MKNLFLKARLIFSILLFLVSYLHIHLEEKYRLSKPVLVFFLGVFLFLFLGLIQITSKPSPHFYDNSDYSFSSKEKEMTHEKQHLEQFFAHVKTKKPNNLTETYAIEIKNSSNKKELFTRYQDFIEVNPPNPTILINAALLAWQLQEVELAEMYTLQAISISPQLERIYYSLDSDSP